MAGLARRSLATLTTFVLLAAAGFTLGALAGILWEQPRLILSYLTGGTTEIAWGGNPETGEAGEAGEAGDVGEAALPDVAAGPDGIGPVMLAAQPEKAHAPEPASSERDAAPAREAAPKPAPVVESAPKPPQRAPVAAPPAPKPAGQFSIQVGAFGSSEAAESLAKRLVSKGYAAYVTPGAGGGQSRWRVRVGPVADKASADSLAARLKKNEKLPTWILDKASN